jgi:hypothetical protein
MARHHGNILSTFPRLISFIFLVGVPVMLCILYCSMVALMCLDAMNNLKDETARSEGIIVSCQYSDEDCQPTVDFTTASGEKFEFVSPYAQGILLLYKGKEVTVSYNPRNPHNVMIISLEFWIGFLFYLLGVLIMMLFAGIGVITYLQPSVAPLPMRQ